MKRIAFGAAVWLMIGASAQAQQSTAIAQPPAITVQAPATSLQSLASDLTLDDAIARGLAASHRLPIGRAHV